MLCVSINCLQTVVADQFSGQCHFTCSQSDKQTQLVRGKSVQRFPLISTNILKMSREIFVFKKAKEKNKNSQNVKKAHFGEKNMHIVSALGRNFAIKYLIT